MVEVGESIFKSVESMQTQMGSVDRAILEENVEILLRRWELVNRPIEGSLADVNWVQTRWFPGQRDLFDTLGVLTKEEVVNIASVKAPLFRIRFPLQLEKKQSFVQRIAPEYHGKDQAHRDELYLALLSRLDALRLQPTLASTLYGLSSRQATYLGYHTPRELRGVLDDPLIALEPCVTEQFFTIAAMTKMSVRDRTLLAVSCRAAVC